MDRDHSKIIEGIYREIKGLVILYKGKVNIFPFFIWRNIQESNFILDKSIRKNNVTQPKYFGCVVIKQHSLFKKPTAHELHISFHT